jgi:hypothetical protein
MERSMKYCLEFGMRRGPHVDNLVFPTLHLASATAHNLQAVFDGGYTRANDWTLGKKDVRRTWRNDTYFIALSKLDGVARGPA